MIGLLCFVMAALSSPFKSKIQLEAENAVLRHQLIVCGASCAAPQTRKQRSLVLHPAISLVPSILKVFTVIGPACTHYCLKEPLRRRIKERLAVSLVTETQPRKRQCKGTILLSLERPNLFRRRRILQRSSDWRDFLAAARIALP